MPPAHTRPPPFDRSTYWRHTLRLTAVLLCLWISVTVGVVFFARPLSRIIMFGWPVSYYMAAQGAIFIYVLIVGVYAACMNRLDKKLKEAESHDK